MLQPLADALVRSVPLHPADDGLFGPRSVAWRVHRDRGLPVAGVRALMIQALHPLTMAGVAHHSRWREDMLGRLAATSAYVLTVTYGDTAAARAAGERVRAVHRSVHGIDRVTGLPYSAEDPELLLWVHMALVDSFLDTVGRYGRPLSAAEADTYVEEMTAFAEVSGVPPGMAPRSVAALHEATEAVTLTQLTPAAAEAIATVLDPPELDEDLRDLWADVGRVATGCLPRWAREMHGLPQPDPAELERETVRQLLGVLDLAFEARPGVLEARRRVELRMRQ